MLPKRQTYLQGANYVLAECLIILPFIFIESVSQQVFIDPLEVAPLSNKCVGTYQWLDTVSCPQGDLQSNRGDNYPLKWILINKNNKREIRKFVLRIFLDTMENKILINQDKPGSCTSSLVWIGLFLSLFSIFVLFCFVFNRDMIRQQRKGFS